MVSIKRISAKNPVLRHIHPFKVSMLRMIIHMGLRVIKAGFFVGKRNCAVGLTAYLNLHLLQRIRYVPVCHFRKILLLY
ncbi:hypothetical protein D3C75_454130 [compost metagenome]